MGEIFGGATFWARQTIESDIFYKKPDKWFKIWFYIVSKVNHRTNTHFERGTNYFNFASDSKFIGCTHDQWKKCIKWLRESHMIDTKPSTRGALIKVLSYAKYQELKNYTSTQEALEEHSTSTLINKNEELINEKEIEKETKVSKKKKEILFPLDSEEYQLASLLLEQVRLNNPSFKQPNLHKWAEVISLMIRLDKRKAPVIQALIYWVGQDKFWKQNILSTEKLRQHFDKIYIKAKVDIENNIPKETLIFN